MITDETQLWKSRLKLVMGLLRTSQSDTTFLIDKSAFLVKLASYGFPSNFEEFEALCDVPADQNAASDYLEAFDAYATAGLDLVKAVTQERVGSDMMSPVIGHIDRALSRTHCSFEKDWRKGIDVDFSHLMKMKRLSEVCLARAELAHTEGNTAGVFQELTRAVGISVHTREPALISCISSIAIEMKTLKVLARLCASDPDQMEFLDVARDWLSRLPPLPDRKSALAFELLLIAQVLADGDRKGMLTGIELSPWHPTRWAIAVLLRAEMSRRQVMDRFYGRLLSHLGWGDGSAVRAVTYWSDYDDPPTWRSDEFEHIAWMMQSPYSSHFFAWVRAEQMRELASDLLAFLAEARTPEERRQWQPPEGDRSLGSKHCHLSRHGLILVFANTVLLGRPERGAALQVGLPERSR